VAQLDIPDIVYNWSGDFFKGHSHQTRPKYCYSVSSLKHISASIIRGRGQPLGQRLTFLTRLISVHYSR